MCMDSNVNFIYKCLKNLFKYIYVIFIFLFTVFPFFWILSSSFKGPGEIFNLPPTIIPIHLTFENYIKAVQMNRLLLYAKNSIQIAVFSTLLTVIIGALAAYALSSFVFKGRKTINKAMLLTQMFPRAVTIIPLFVLCKYLGLINTPYALIFGNLAGTVPVSVILLTGYFMDIPRELEEVSRIDGCNTFTVLTKIILPLALPGIVASAIYTFIGVWQEFLMALSFTSDKDKFTLPVGLTTFVGQHSTDWGGLMATSVVIAVPAIILFVSVQSYFIDNLAGSVKG